MRRINWNDGGSRPVSVYVNIDAPVYVMGAGACKSVSGFLFFAFFFASFFSRFFCVCVFLSLLLFFYFLSMCAFIYF